jgi:protein XagA
MRGWADPRLYGLLASISFTTPCVAGAFLQPQGEGVAIFTTSFAKASRAYDSLGRLVAAPAYDKLETQLYAEYGLYEELTLVAETNYLRFRGAGAQKQAAQLAILTEEAKAGAALYLPPGVGEGARYAGPGAQSFGVRVKLLQLGAATLSAQGSLRAAIGEGRKFLDMSEYVQGDGRLEIGWPIELLGMQGFSTIEIGYRSAGQNGAEMRGEFTAGLRPLDSVLLLAQGFTYVAPWAADGAFTVSHRLQLSAVYDLTREVAVQVGARAALRGVNDSAERGLIGALWYRF